MADNAYSRLVGAAKVMLPLAGLALLSTMFLLARQIDPEAALPYAEVDVAALLREPRLTAPSFSGVTREGTEVLFSAATAIPGPAGQGGRASLPRLELLAPDGGRTVVTAAEGRLDPSAQLLELTGEVRIEAAGSYLVESAQMLAALDRSRVESPGPVVAQGPQGRVEAGSFTLSRNGPDAAEVLVFKSGVKLLYQPGPDRPAE